MRASLPAAGILLIGAVLAGCTSTWESVLSFAKKSRPSNGVVLSAGQAAVDIDGKDVDGGKFKLSDYRGKVVMLDFWGNW